MRALASLAQKVREAFVNRGSKYDAEVHKSYSCGILPVVQQRSQYSEQNNK